MSSARIGGRLPAGRCKHRPLHPLYRWYCRGVLTPPGCFARAETFVFCLPIKIIRRGRRPRRPGRGLGYRLWRGQAPSLRTNLKRSICGRIWNPPLRRKNAGCLTVVGADSISARPGRRRLAAKTMAAIRQSRPARAVQCPTGALIAARPRNAAPYTLARPYPLAEESAAGSRQTNIC